MSSINHKTLLYLIYFSIFILLLLWLSLIVYFRYSYENYQIKTMNKMATSISELGEENFKENIEAIAYRNEVCIELITKTNNTFKFNTMMVGCGLGKNNSDLVKLQHNFIESDIDTEAYRIENIEYKTQAYLYALKTKYGSIFLYSPLEDLSGASTVLRNQLIYLTFIAIIVACLISYFLSHKITDPILDITKKAKDLGKGNHDINFVHYGISEIDDLANVLENAQVELAKTDELRRDLLANVSHDLKTPLTMIKAYAEMVRDLSYKSDEKRITHCNVIIQETERLNILVNDILVLSKMQANAESLKIEKFDLIKEINEIVKRYEIIKETEDYKFTIETPKKAIVYADKNKINQVIYNLVNNAINYTGKDKTVKIVVKDQKDKYQVLVIDSGKGIKAEEISYIWDKYYKNDKNHQRNVVGTGIGLSIVKTILEKHNFEYGVNSELKKGSQFYFYINKKK